MLFILLFATLDINAIGVTVEEGLLKKGEFIYMDQQGAVQGHITEPGKLPLTCTYATIFKWLLIQSFLAKEQNLLNYVWQDILPPLIMSK